MSRIFWLRRARFASSLGPPNMRLKLTAPVPNESVDALKSGVVEFRL